MTGMLEGGGTAAIGGADGIAGTAADADGVVGAAEANEDDETV